MNRLLSAPPGILLFPRQVPLTSRNSPIRVGERGPGIEPGPFAVSGRCDPRAGTGQDRVDVRHPSQWSPR